MKATLAGDLHAAGEARAFVGAQLTLDYLPDGVALDNVLLVVDELVTNAVQAGASAIEIDLVAAPRQLDLIVRDDAVGWPTPRSATDEDVSGRGLAIVELITDHWTVDARMPGKAVTAVWFGTGHPHRKD